MAKYIGYVKIEESYPWPHFFFTPLVKIANGFTILTEADQDKLLKNSTAHNLELGYSFKDDQKTSMYEYFPDNALIVCEFEKDDLKETTTRDICSDVLLQFPYASKNYGEKIWRLDDSADGSTFRHHFMRIIHSNEIDDGFYSNPIDPTPFRIDVGIDSPEISVGEDVVVELNDMWAGPYTISRCDDDNSFCIIPKIKEQKYVISGYKKTSNVPCTLDTPNVSYLLPSTTDKCQLDVMSNDDLVSSFLNSVKSSVVVDGTIPVKDIPKLLEHYEISAFFGNDISDEIRTQRLTQLKEIFASNTEIDDLTASLLGNNPVLMEKLVYSSPVTIAAEEKNKQLQQKNRELEAVIACKVQESQKLDETITKQKGEQKRKEGALDYIQDEISKAKDEKNDLYNSIEDVKIKFEKMLSNLNDNVNTNIVNTALDGFKASRVLQAAAKWEAEESDKKHRDMVDKIYQVSGFEFTTTELVKYLCDMVHTVRPSYSPNTILNIAICMTQGFLTVFSGEPGCGKTSICNIFGEILGLNQIANARELADIQEEDRSKLKRYISVSVERGWTSKRDFVGYYNPLSKTFDKSNRKVYDALHLLHTEKKDGKYNFPYIILLDEANLSPMEYYWSDFMNLCDKLDSESHVNLGEDYIFKIPETLHFVATINNDDTTERLSPRLIDRAWIISLPPYDGTLAENTEIPTEKIQIVPWSALKKAFLPTSTSYDFFPEDVYKDIIKHLKSARITVNARTDRAIRQYWAVSSQYFCPEIIEDKEDGTEVEVTDTNMLALDYAVMQKLLPKISGNDSDFVKFLDGLKQICRKHNLKHSEGIIYDIIARGKYGYYNFFN